MKNRFKKRMMEWFTKGVVALGRTKRKFLTMHTRPMYAKTIKYRGKDCVADRISAIVVQGPIKKGYRFTLETIKLYHQHYPSATIILSTWQGENTGDFEKLAAHSEGKLKIVKSPKPSCGGPGNINMQVSSALAGIKLAKELGLRYVMKTRTDQRMYGIKTLEFLINMLEIFPLPSVKNQKKRIVGMNTTTTLRYMPYHVSDTWMFGTTEDMLNYWDYPYQNKPATDPKHPLVERSLFMNFLKKTSWDTKDTVDDFLNALGQRCVIVGNESVDIYWPKYYERFREHRTRDYEFPNFEISFKEWFNRAFVPYYKKHDS